VYSKQVIDKNNWDFVCRSKVWHCNWSS